jgi:hypothetical protein
MKADTVDILTQKGRFPTEQALAVAEAIDMAISDAQLVTIPVLDARFARLEARIDQKFDRLRLQLIMAILVGNAAMGPLGAALLDAIKRAI